MLPVDRTVEVLPGVRRWSSFSPEHRVELSATAVRAPEGWWIFDPLPLAEAERERFGAETVAGIIATNANHERDTPSWAARFALAPWAAPEAASALAGFRAWPPGETRLSGWELLPLPGGAPGETAFLLPGQGLAVFGDAVVNLPGRGLEILPDRYCLDPLQLRQSLARLPPFAHALFAHGTPLIGHASALIRELLTWEG